MDGPFDPGVEEELEAEPQRDRIWLHVLLFVATFVTTTMVGLELSLGRLEAGQRPAGPSFGFWADGFSYSLSIMAILTAHEMGHYLEARRRGLPASLPYFIPMITAFGTLGAFIRLRLERQVPARDLLKVAAYGPLAGMAVTVPVLLVGMALSDVRPTPADISNGTLGGSALLWLSEHLFFSHVRAGFGVWLHPMAFAGWAGLFVTALNLMPISQLDGGHIAYTLLGEPFNRVAPVLFVGLVALGAVVFPGWLIICILVVVVGVRHPPLCPDAPVRGRWGRALGWFALAIFLLCFTPRPFGGVHTLLDWLLR